MLYCNDGDWVESCTSIVEHKDGRLELLHWASRFERSTLSEVEELVGFQAFASVAQSSSKSPVPCDDTEEAA